MKITKKIKLLSGSLSVGEFVGTSIGELHILSSLGGNVFGTNQGIFHIVP